MWKIKKKKCKKACFFLVAAAVLLVVNLIFYSLGWFTNTKSNQANGVQLQSEGENFEIKMLDDGENGKWYDPYHKKIQEVSGSSALIWQMTDDHNMGNYTTVEENEGINPGSAGSVSFYVNPKIDTVKLNFNFEVIGYRQIDDKTNNTFTMEALTASSTPAIYSKVANYLNGHILLFENRTQVGEEYIYSGLIASDADMKRVLQKEFKKSGGDKQQVTIYWVWPKTLSTLVDATNCEVMSITQTPFTNKSDENDTTRQDILDNILAYPQYYLKDVERITEVVDGTEVFSYTAKGETVTPLSAGEIAAKYDVYGDLYDQVDNDIGINVKYVLLKMSVEEVTASPG